MNDDVIYPVGYIAPTFETLNAALLAQLEDIDRKSVRALREGDTARIAQLNEQAATLRSQFVQP